MCQSKARRKLTGTDDDGGSKEVSCRQLTVHGVSSGTSISGGIDKEQQHQLKHFQSTKWATLHKAILFFVHRTPSQLDQLRVNIVNKEILR